MKVFEMCLKVMFESVTHDIIKANKVVSGVRMPRIVGSPLFLLSVADRPDKRRLKYEVESGTW